MSYLFATEDEQRQMLSAIGAASIDELLEQVPAELRLPRPLDLPEPLTELELESHVRKLAARNQGASSSICFAGGGAYDHFIPAVVDEITSRGEFYTAYTPYQAEASQGSLQAFFEFQTLICQLTDMDVSNASLYEGATSVSEAVFMAMRVTRRHGRIVLLGSLHPEYTRVVRTYTQHLGCEVVVVPTPGGRADLEAVDEALDEQTACLVIQHPNFLGCLEEAPELVELAHRYGALGVVSVDPASLGVLRRPGTYDADIVVAEGQPLGTPLQFGGPYLGILAAKESFVRQMPGRLIGQTLDRHDNRCFVLNLQAREQHIRREKATSNICTNQGLLALRATVYLSLLGPAGTRAVGELSCRKAHYAGEQLSAIDGLELMFEGPYFKEFVVRSRDGAASTIEKARQAGFTLGPALSRYPELRTAFGETVDEMLLIAVTESRTKTEIDHLAACLSRNSAQAEAAVS